MTVNDTTGSDTTVRANPHPAASEPARPRRRLGVAAAGLGVLTAASVALLVLAARGTPARPAAVHGPAARLAVLAPWTPAARFLLAVAVVVAATHTVGALLRRVGQPAVVGEIIAGILLGPSLLGAVAPGVWRWLFPADVLSALDMTAQFGLVAFMYLLGCELRPDRLRGRGPVVAAVGTASLAVPFLCALPATVLLYRRHGGATSAVGFAVFLGLALAITALPVLARILEDRRMVHTPVGTLALSVAVIGDVAAWVALACVLAVTGNTGTAAAPVSVALLAVFALVMVTVVRRGLAALVGRCAAARFPEATLLPVVLVGASLSAVATQLAGVHAVFGGFLFGAIMPRQHPVVARVGERIRGIVVAVLLPLFFAYVGLHTAVGSLGGSAGGWLICLGVIALAMVTKLAGAAGSARLVGLPGHEALTLGVLMNCRGITELIIAGVGLQLHIIDTYLFTVLVLMALATTAMTGPLLHAVQRWQGRAGARQDDDAPRRPVIDTGRLRTVLGRFATGVTVVTTTTADGQPIGMTANSFSSVSMDPPLVLFCVSRQSRLHPHFTQAPGFAVNVLSGEQRDVSRLFARPGLDRFGDLRPGTGSSGAPLLAGTLAGIECVTEQVVAAGDHDIVIGRVLAVDSAATTAPEPLIFYGGGYRALDNDGVDCWAALG
jgi:K+:H+ antiporter